MPSEKAEGRGEQLSYRELRYEITRDINQLARQQGSTLLQKGVIQEQGHCAVVDNNEWQIKSGGRRGAPGCDRIQQEGASEAEREGGTGGGGSKAKRLAGSLGGGRNEKGRGLAGNRLGVSQGGVGHGGQTKQRKADSPLDSPLECPKWAPNLILGVVPVRTSHPWPSGAAITSATATAKLSERIHPTSKSIILPLHPIPVFKFEKEKEEQKKQASK
ncbi:hypothetical protein PAAG_03875 [Paracoccidioides lutzii Pb01]|uniref:Uncharacterized protein n=1 Tax=Paracoccidioides lutzii (strain ATCC MYA-826 / Pb01) TaxID=502779 RepID=C1GZD1_PARBA|nr:hypothetical protein PAAG_03875 [Paracoccidioides lutzii Pb01]EEH41954.2 hypothetical protein PAAG_03875 [Paracoccidioides lutzii Pb01]